MGGRLSGGLASSSSSSSSFVVQSSEREREGATDAAEAFLEKQKRVEDKRRRRGKCLSFHQQIRKNVFWSLLFAVAIAWNGMARNVCRSIASRLMRSDVVVVFTSDELEKQSLHYEVSLEKCSTFPEAARCFTEKGKSTIFLSAKIKREGFLSGREEEGSADVDAMTNSEVLEVEKWIQFYRSGGSRGTYRREAC